MRVDPQRLLQNVWIKLEVTTRYFAKSLNNIAEANMILKLIVYLLPMGPPMQKAQ